MNNECILHNSIVLAICVQKKYQIWWKIDEVVTKQVGTWNIFGPPCRLANKITTFKTSQSARQHLTKQHALTKHNSRQKSRPLRPIIYSDWSRVSGVYVLQFRLENGTNNASQLEPYCQAAHTCKPLVA